MSNIIIFPNVALLREKKATLLNSVKCLESLTLAALSELELPYYGVCDIPPQVYNIAEQISRELITRQETVKNMRSSRIEEIDLEIGNIRKAICFLGP